MNYEMEHPKTNLIFTDILGKKWRLGETIGTGGFGEIYLASDNTTRHVGDDAPYVAKVESHTSGPLFVEIHCYLTIGKLDSIKQWKEENGIDHLGIPNYIACGSHKIDNKKYRFLILPRFENDLEHMFEIKRRKFNLKTVLTIALQLIDTLQYIHNKGYVHSDIKASNILFNSKKNTKLVVTMSVMGRIIHSSMPIRACRLKKLKFTLSSKYNLRRYRNLSSSVIMSDSDHIYLLDYGLATKYLTADKEHKHFCYDQRKAHVGTILFCSRDAHRGAQSRRSDLECLGYNLIYWLTSDLLWNRYTDDPEFVYKKKSKCFENLRLFLALSFNNECPKFIYDYFVYLQNLDFEEQPNYKYLKMLFKKAMEEYGYNNNLSLDFDNLEGWGRKQKKTKAKLDDVRNNYVVHSIQRSPLKSNLAVKPILRKQLKQTKQKIHWSKILMDPEGIIKKAKNKERKITESSDHYCSNSISNLDLSLLNPTRAMSEVYNKYMGNDSTDLVTNMFQIKHTISSINIKLILNTERSLMLIQKKLLSTKTVSVFTSTICQIYNEGSKKGKYENKLQVGKTLPTKLQVLNKILQDLL